MINPDINILLSMPGVVPFDPVERADLTDAQVRRMEQILCAVTQLKDGAGLRIKYDMDFWIAAQLAAMLYSADGTAKNEAIPA